MERFSVSRLIGESDYFKTFTTRIAEGSLMNLGSPPGYVGFEEGGILTDAIRRRPYQLVLLDEFEKAHREVSNLLLQVFDEGRLTDSQGRTVDFRNTVIILTSNLGSDILAKYAAEEDPDSPKPDANGNKLESRKVVATKIVHQHFSPEFVNRLDDVIVFNALNQEAIMKICSIQMKKVKSLFEEKKVRFHFTKKAAEAIASSGTNLQYGARPLKRLIQNEVLSPLATKILSGDLREGDELHLIAEDESVDYIQGKTKLSFNLEFSSTSSSAAADSEEVKEVKRIVKAIVIRSTAASS
jgi:ATP-dependent Clp protease ATP-binding subunit ClpB